MTTRLALAVSSLVAVSAVSVEARLLITSEDALRQIYGLRARSEARTAYFTDGEVERVRKLAKAPFSSRHVTYYRVTLGDSLLGQAFLDQHVVRSLSETVLIALDPAGRVLAVEVLAWNEPDDFRPPERWLARARGIEDPGRARPGEAMPHLAGATLSARAVTAAIRRALALRQVIANPEPRTGR